MYSRYFMHSDSYLFKLEQPISVNAFDCISQAPPLPPLKKVGMEIPKKIFWLSNSCSLFSTCTEKFLLTIMSHSIFNQECIYLQWCLLRNIERCIYHCFLLIYLERFILLFSDPDLFFVRLNLEGILVVDDILQTSNG